MLCYDVKDCLVLGICWCYAMMRDCGAEYSENVTRGGRLKGQPESVRSLSFASGFPTIEIDYNQTLHSSPAVQLFQSRSGPSTRAPRGH